MNQKFADLLKYFYRAPDPYSIFIQHRWRTRPRKVQGSASSHADMMDRKSRMRTSELSLPDQCSNHYPTVPGDPWIYRKGSGRSARKQA